jgi:hypothetical protein
MTRVQGVTGGGIDGRNVVHTKAPKREPVAHAISPGAVSRFGSMVGEGTPHKALYSGQGYGAPVGPTDNMGQGPGANREIYRAGSQSPTPQPTPMGSGRSLFQNSPLKERRDEP